MAARFYVTMRDAGRTGWLLGPYRTHREALANVRRGHDLALAADGWAHFYAFGTAKVTGRQKARTVFGQ